MPSQAIALVVIVAAGQSHEPATTALADAARATTGTKVIVEEAQAPSDDEALAIAGRDRAEMVAVVAWDDDRSHATVHLHRAGDARWLDRAVGFQPQDAPSERGRTIGFAIASMLPEPAPPPPTPPPPTPPLSPGEQAHALPGADAGTAPPAVEKTWHGEVDASGTAMAGIGGYGGGVGATIAGHWLFLPWASLRLGLGIRSGQVEPAQATLLSAWGSLGVGLRALRSHPGQPFELGGRAGFLVLRESMSHLSADDPTANVQGRWLPGAEAKLEGCFYFVPNAAVLLAGGIDVAMGETTVYVLDKPVATLSAWRAGGEIGLRARF